jgi:hypothetical protein
VKLAYNDQAHAYHLDGRRCKSVTTVAKIPDDTYNLEKWGMRQVALGLAQNRGLVEAVAAHAEDRDKLNELCEQAKAIAGANDASRRGTAAHRITELHDQGKNVIQTELATSILASWQEVLDAAGLEVVPEWMERIVVYPEHYICGKFDRILRRRSDGALVIADLKTGERAIKYPHSIAVQMALYANAPLVAGDMPPSGGSTTEFEPLPAELDRATGYIIHIPEMGTASVAEVDIAGGWDIAQEVCFRTLAWRKRTDLVRPLTVESRSVEHMATIEFEGVTVTAPVIDISDADETAGTWVDDSETRAVLQTRIDGIRSHGEDALKALALALQGNDLPSLKKSNDHTPAQLKLMGKLIDRVEAAHAVSFPENIVPIPPAAKLVEPVTITINREIVEGTFADPEATRLLREYYEAISDECRAWISACAADAKRAGYSFELKALQSVRRFEILRALLAAWTHDGDEELCRAVIALVTGEEFARQPVIPIGACFGALTIDEARTAVHVFDHLADGTATVRVQPDQTIAVVDGAVQAA